MAEKIKLEIVTPDSVLVDEDVDEVDVGPGVDAKRDERLGLRDAYRFARGEEVIASSGQPVQLARPLLLVKDLRGTDSD